MQVAAGKSSGRWGPKPEGFVLWMTGLPGSGKSTLARLLRERLVEEEGRNVEVLDGDEIRKGLSHDLGLSKEDREEHNRRVAYVAKVLARNGVVVIVALISPYETTRDYAREMVGRDRFVEVYIKAPWRCARRGTRRGSTPRRGGGRSRT